MLTEIKRVPQINSTCVGCVYGYMPGEETSGCKHPDGSQAGECNRTLTIFQAVPAPPTSRTNDPATSKGKRKVNKYEQAVLSFLACNPDGTGKEIASGMREPLNCITPRFAPLRRKGLIKPLYNSTYGIAVVKRDKQIVWVLA